MLAPKNKTERIFVTEDQAIVYSRLLIINKFKDINLDQYRPTTEYNQKTDTWTISYTSAGDKTIHMGGGTPYTSFKSDGTVYKVLLQK